MARPSLLLIASLPVLLPASSVVAGSLSGLKAVERTMCDYFFTSAEGCDAKDCGSVEAVEFDAPVKVLTPDRVVRTQLLVYFHGHGGDPTGPSDLLLFAAALGYDVVSLDYDYGRDYPQRPADNDCHPAPGHQKASVHLPNSAQCTHTFDKARKDSKSPNAGKSIRTCDMGLDPVCGCFSDCYGQRWNSIWRGGAGAGLPTVADDWSINTRLRHVIERMAEAHPRYKGYLDAGQLGGINWAGSKQKGKATKGIVAVGHSLGASLAAYIAKHQRIDRLVMISGPGDKLAPDTTSDRKHWEDAYGCDIDKVRSGPFGVTKCTETTFGYRAANNIAYCSPSTAAVAWIADNRFPRDKPDHTGADWKTSNSHFYGFINSNDAVCNWQAPSEAIISTHRNWITLGVDRQARKTDPAPGWTELRGAGTGTSTIPAAQYHGVVVIDRDRNGAQICQENDVSGHRATVFNEACALGPPGTPDGTDALNRQTVWRFILTGETK